MIMNKLIFILLLSFNLFGLEFSQVSKDMRKACSVGDLEKVEELVSMGANINLGNYIPEMPLYIASSKGYLNIVKYLLAQGANVQSRGYYGSSLSAASAKGHLDIVIALLNNGADVHYKHPCSDRTALKEALDNNEFDVAEYLIYWMKSKNMKIF